MSLKLPPHIRVSLLWLICLLWASAGFAQPILTVKTINPTCDTRVQPTSSARLGNGSITAVATGGTPPYIYDLKLDRGPQSNGYFPGLSSGNYVVEVTDALGNKASLNVFLSNLLPDPFLNMKVLQLLGQSFAPTPTVMTGKSYEQKGTVVLIR